MAVQASPSEMGIHIEPVQQVADWASDSIKKAKLGETAVSYQDFIQQHQRGEQ